MMHPAFSEFVLREKRRDLEQRVKDAHLRRKPDAHEPPAEPVTLRLSSVHDDDVLARLATLEGHAAPAGQHVVAEVGGAVVAALPLLPGPMLADPFRPTAHLAPLLELRAKQLADGRPRRRTVEVWSAVRNWSRA